VEYYHKRNEEIKGLVKIINIIFIKDEKFKINVTGSYFERK
jgi:hypothetical protein